MLLGDLSGTWRTWRTWRESCSFPGSRRLLALIPAGWHRRHGIRIVIRTIVHLDVGEVGDFHLDLAGQLHLAFRVHVGDVAQDVLGGDVARDPGDRTENTLRDFRGEF